ncbi:hypothetical protein RB594_002223 [Gaeumannomyces avenae]
MGLDDAKQKRKLAPKPDASQKRRRVHEAAKSKKPKRAVRADALLWRSVDVPDMYDDAEGFFGLEEVEGVDVVREDGMVKFVTAGPTVGDDEDEFGGFDDSSESPDTAPEETEPTAKTDDGPESNAEATDVVGKGKKEKKPHQKKQETQKKKQEQQKQGRPAKAEESMPADELAGGASFAALGDVDEEGEDIDMSQWVPLDLSGEMLSSIARLKFSKPTAIQAQAIPEILAGHDVIGKASTGSGKTLAFGIPIVERWISLSQTAVSKSPEEGKKPIALVLSPTRELAHQITNHFKALCGGLATAPYICSVTGGLSVHKQQRQLEKADIVIATPGRLWEVLSSSKQTVAAFRHIKYLVVDEADRLLSDGHFKDAEEIMRALDRIETTEDGDNQGPPPRQTLVFSATLNKGLQQKLAGKGRFDLNNDALSMEYLLKRLKFREEKPKFIDANPVSQMAARLKEGLVECDAMEKDLYLYSLLLMHPTQHTLVFTNSISSVRRLTPMLQNLTLPALALHSQMPQKARLRSVERFTAAKPGTSSILIATDVAARGLDIKGIDVVIHYHVPRAADAYVHRSGRTARAENTGLSVLICAPDEVTPTRRLVAKVHATGRNRKQQSVFLQSIDLDRRLVGKLKERVSIAKRIADSTLAKEKVGKEDDWMRTAAEELGVEYDSEELEKAGNWSGRGSGRKSKQKEARSMSKGEVAALRAQLKQLLSKRVNTGVSERYIANGNVDVHELLSGSKGDFLGKVDGLGVSPLLVED